MKRLAAVMTVVILILGCALAEGLTEYSDRNYSFQHPADWTRDTSEDGTVILRSPDGKAYIRAGILLMDLFTFTGDAKTDARFVQVVMQSFAGDGSDQSELTLDGSYELITAGEMKGFRAPGTWKKTGDRAVLTAFTDGGSMVYFLMAGEAAVALEDVLTSSLRTAGHLITAENGMKKWESDQISLSYPEAFSMVDTGQAGVVFTEITKHPSMISVMTSELPNAEYNDEYGLESMQEVLKQAGADMVETAEIREIGGRNVVAAEGHADDTPGAIYVFGQGKTVVVLNFAGQHATEQAETVIASVEFK